MLLKIFIDSLNIIYFSLFLLFLYLLNFFIITADIQKKFFLFIINFALFTCISFYYNLDGIVLMFIISELTILLVFLVVLSQIYI